MKYGYHKHSLLEVVMFRVKKLLEGTLSLKDHNAQINEIYDIMKALNELTDLGMPNTKVIVS